MSPRETFREALRGRKNKRWCIGMREVAVTDWAGSREICDGVRVGGGRGPRSLSAAAPQRLTFQGRMQRPMQRPSISVSRHPVSNVPRSDA